MSGPTMDTTRTMIRASSRSAPRQWLRGGLAPGSNAHAKPFDGACWRHLSVGIRCALQHRGIRADLAYRALRRGAGDADRTTSISAPSSATAQGDLVTQVTPQLAIDEKGARTSLHGIIAVPALVVRAHGRGKQSGLSVRQPARNRRGHREDSSLSRARSTSRSNISPRSERSRRVSPTQRRTAIRRQPIA